MKQIRGWNWKDTNVLHPDDLQGLFETWQAIVASGEPGAIQAHASFRWRVSPVLDLKQVQFVDQDTVRFLARCEMDGVKFMLPPWLERQRKEIEAVLRPLELPHQGN